MAATTQARATQYAKAVIARSTDWQEVQHALFEHDEFGPWLRSQDNDGMNVIRAAEETYGRNLPSGYSD